MATYLAEHVEVPPLAVGAPFDVVLRPSVGAAERTVDVTEVWHDVVVFKGVPRSRPPTETPRPRQVFSPTPPAASDYDPNHDPTED